MLKARHGARHRMNQYGIPMRAAFVLAIERVKAATDMQGLE